MDMTAGMYLGARDMNHAVDETDGIGCHADALSTQTDAPSVQTDALTPANTPETVSIRPTELKPPDLPGKGIRWTLHELNSDRKPADTSSGRTDIQCIEMDAKMATYAPQIVRTRPNDPKPPNSPSGDMKCDVNETDGLGGHADASNGQMNAPSVDMDAIRPTNKSERLRTPPSSSKTKDLPMETARPSSDEPDGYRNRTDRLNARTHVQSVAHEMEMATNTSKTVSICQIELKSPNLPAGSATLCSDATDSFGSHTDMSSVCTDVHCTGNNMQMATNEVENIRTRPNDSKTQHLPHMHEITTPKPTIQWKWVSIGDGDMYVPWNVPIDRTS